MKTMKTRLRGEWWKVVSLTAPQFAAVHGENIDAITLAATRTLVFPAGATMATVRHEVFHAFVSTLYLNQADELSISDAEELMAGLYSECHDQMNRLARRIHKFIHSS